MIIKRVSLISLIYLFIGIMNTQAYSESNFNYLNVIDAEALAKNYATPGVGNSIDPFATKNNLYQQILDEMNLEYENIGRREAARVLSGNQSGVSGGLNSIGFTYKRPFIDFSISVDRNLAPDLFDDKRWIVTDTFSIFVDASKILSNLKDKQVIDIDQKNLAAFAGVVFKRNITWIHYANSYNEGLTTHFEKLFLPFAAMNFENVSKLETNEMIFKEDSLSFHAGGFVSAPLYSGITGMGGILAKFQKLSRVELVTSPTASGNGDELHLSYEKSKAISGGVSLSIQADFLQILRMTLLSYDFNYELSESYKMYLNFLQSDLRQMIPGDAVAVEVGQLLKNREGDLDVLAPYVISEEKRISQTIEHKYNFLILGGSKSSKTQQIEITSEGKTKNFFRHYYEKIKYTEDILSRIFASVIYALTNSDVRANKLASETRQVAIEYDSEKNLLENHEDLALNKAEQMLSLSFNTEFMTKKTVGFGSGKYKDRALFMLERFSGVDPLATQMLMNDHLRAPLSIAGRYQINTEGIRYLNSQSVGAVFDTLDGLCNEYPRNKFINFRNLFDNCRRSLQNDYLNYFADLSHDKVTALDIEYCENEASKYIFSSSKKRAFLNRCLSLVTYKSKEEWVKIPLWTLKNFTNNLVKNCNSKVHYYNLFGLKNVFFFGSFNAVTEDGREFTTSFHEGEFKGFGVVDNYMRVENLRAPSSIVVDQ